MCVCVHPVPSIMAKDDLPVILNDPSAEIRVADCGFRTAELTPSGRMSHFNCAWDLRCVGPVKRLLVDKPHKYIYICYPGKRPQTVWGSGRIMDDNVEDDDDEDTLLGE